VLRAGSRRFGAPDPDTLAALNSIADVDRLEQMNERILDAASWADVIRDA
jgi:hypothetical protein